MAAEGWSTKGKQQDPRIWVGKWPFLGAEPTHLLPFAWKKHQERAGLEEKGKLERDLLPKAAVGREELGHGEQPNGNLPKSFPTPHLRTKLKGEEVVLNRPMFPKL